MHKFGLSPLVLVLTVGCGTAAPVPDRSFPAPDATRVSRLESRAPGMARVAHRLRELAEEAKRRGRAARSRELLQLSDLTLLSGSELLARLDTVAQRLETTEQRLVRSETEPPPKCSSEERGRRVASSGRARRSRRSRRRATRRRDDDLSAPNQEQEARVRKRLAALAGRLAEINSTQANRVTIESVRSILIEADRALAAGDLARAVGHAQEAERLLARLRRGPKKSNDDESDDRQEEYGDRQEKSS